MDVLLPWERLLWSGRPLLTRADRERYLLTDFRLVRVAGSNVDEVLLHDIVDVRRTKSRLDRIVDTSTIVVRFRNGRSAPLVLRNVRHGQQLAALVEWLSSEPRERPSLDAAAIRAAMAWNPQPRSRSLLKTLAGLLRPSSSSSKWRSACTVRLLPAPAYSAEDPIYPNGHRRSDAEIVRFMEDEVMPWARATLGPMKGGSDRIKCETCHGTNPRRAWVANASRGGATAT